MTEAVIRPDWPAPDNVIAASTTRNGGVSAVPYAELNLGLHVGDNEDRVNKNRAIVREQLALPSEPVWLKQVHGNDILRVGHALNAHSELVYDGAITAQREVVCCVMTADCLPLLLCDRLGKQVAAVHVGWRGLAAGIVEQAIRSFTTKPQDLLAWAGPTISVRRFEVGVELRAELGGSAACWRSTEYDSNKCFANLSLLVKERLEQLRVGWFAHANECTYEQHDRFFSHRRDGISGRQASFIYKV